MITKHAPTYTCRVYLSGPVEAAKHLLRAECLREGLCVTVEPTTFIYTGGEESGYVVGLVNYPKFPAEPAEIRARAEHIAILLLEGTHQQSALVVGLDASTWFTRCAR